MQESASPPPTTAPPPREAALPLTWALKASVAGICVLACALILCGRRRSLPEAFPWLLFFIGTAVSSGMYALVEAHPAFDDVGAVAPTMLIAVNLSTVGAFLTGGQLVAMSGFLRPVRAGFTALAFHVSAITLVVGLNVGVFTSEPAAERLDLALSVASIGGLGLLAGAIIGLVSPSQRAVPSRIPNALVVIGVSLTGVGFALGEGWLGPACAVEARCPLPHGLEPEAVEHASLAAACVALGAAASLLTRQSPWSRSLSRAASAAVRAHAPQRQADLREQLLCNAEVDAVDASHDAPGARALGRAWLECGLCGGRALVFRSSCCVRCGFGCCPKCLDDDRAAPLAASADTAAEPTCFVCRLQERALACTSKSAGGDCEAPRDAPPERFVVVGAGIVGSFAALELARRGFAVDVIDAADGPGTWRGIINLNAQGVGLIQHASASLADAVRREHHVARSATFWDATLERPILTYDLSKEGLRYGLPEEMITCERRRLLEQLRDAAVAAGAGRARRPRA